MRTKYLANDDFWSITKKYDIFLESCSILSTSKFFTAKGFFEKLALSMCHKPRQDWHPFLLSSTSKLCHRKRL